MVELSKKLRAAVRDEAVARGSSTGFVSLAEKPARVEAATSSPKAYFPSLHLNKPLKGLDGVGKTYTIEAKVRVRRLEQGQDGASVSLDVLAIRRKRS